jgi:hypothetical protein
VTQAANSNPRHPTPARTSYLNAGRGDLNQREIYFIIGSFLTHFLYSFLIPLLRIVEFHFVLSFLLCM